MISQWELPWYCCFPAGSPVRWCRVGVGRQIPFECMKKTWCWNFIAVVEFILDAWSSFFARLELPFKHNAGFVQNCTLSLVWIYQHLIYANSECTAGQHRNHRSHTRLMTALLSFPCQQGLQSHAPCPFGKAEAAEEALLKILATDASSINWD